MASFFLLWTALDRQHALFIMEKTKQNRESALPSE
jgi:hypothetical protein